MKIRRSFLIFLPFLMVVSSCNGDQQGLSFEKAEYQIHSGEAVKVAQDYNDVKYSLVGERPDGVSVDESSAVITFDENVPHYSQVLLVASKEEMKSAPAVVTLLQNNVTTTLSFYTPIKNICDGDYILVSSAKNTSIKYNLKEQVKGVSIDSMSGRVNYNSAAEDGSAFTVVASSADQSIEETYYVATEHLVRATQSTQSVEIGSKNPATYILDFSDAPGGTEEKIIGLMNESKYAKESEFSYDTLTHTLVVQSSFLSTFKTGVNKMRVITPRNIVNVDIVMITKFIKNAVELQAINKDRESLAGYYVLENDIDLTTYLSKGHEGYNDNRGWNQIGIYHDLEEDPTRDSFTGTFDGNGHVISGFFENRADDLAHNEGLFGYVTNKATIMNVGFVSAKKWDSAKSEWVNIVSKGRNFIGGFVGFNEGTIKNCWVDVSISNKHEDKIFHSVGGFAGGNTGTITNCLSIGYAEADIDADGKISKGGSFVGKNFGDITNCYSFSKYGEKFYASNEGGNVKDCISFTDKAVMKAFDYSDKFDPTAWNFDPGNYPTLKEQTVIEDVNGIEIVNDEKYVSKGQILEVAAAIHPNSLHDAHKDEIVYTLVNGEGSGIVQDGNKFNVNDAVVTEMTVTASIYTTYGDYASSKTFEIKPKVDSINIVDDFPTYIEPGKQYQINYDLAPVGVKADVEFSVEPKEESSKLKPSRYISFEGNIMTVHEEIMNYNTKVANPEIIVKATAHNGKTNSITLKLNRIHYLSKTYCENQLESTETITENVLTYYKDTTATHVEFELPHKAVMVGIQVYKYSTKLVENKDFTRSGYTVRIPIEKIKDIPNREIAFTFYTGDGLGQLIFRGYACYIDHDALTLSQVPTSYITLSSKEDFYQYFRLKQDDKDDSKWANYDKNYVLTSDIDFGFTAEDMKYDEDTWASDKALCSIGYQSSEFPKAKPFTGKIYGFGHTIKNAFFHYTERLKLKGATTPAKKSDSNTYRAGFFGYFAGEIYDVKFENIKALSYNYAGCFAGVINGGLLENVQFHKCKTICANETDYTIDDVICGRVCATNAGTFIGVSYNGTTVGLVGK